MYVLTSKYYIVCAPLFWELTTGISLGGYNVLSSFFSSTFFFVEQNRAPMKSRISIYNPLHALSPTSVVLLKNRVHIPPCTVHYIPVHCYLQAVCSRKIIFVELKSLFNMPSLKRKQRIREKEYKLASAKCRKIDEHFKDQNKVSSILKFSTTNSRFW